jgi:Xaa-Pro dipeptidase
MYLHFDLDEFAQRISRVRNAMRQEELAALILFAQESHYYLTGFDTTGFVFFQCLVISAEEKAPVLLTRRPDLLQARLTSTINDIRLWYDSKDADPTRELLTILEELEAKGQRVGIELNSFGLRAKSYQAVAARIGAWCELVDASHLVHQVRLIKSPAELAYIRRAAELADNALIAMTEASVPGAFEGDIAAAGSNVLLRGGCDPSPSGPVLGSGPRALLVRATTNYRKLDPVDQITIEFAASYRHYCACLMRTLAIGRANATQKRFFEVTREALVSMTDAARPGRVVGEIDQAHRRVYDVNGFAESRMSACGYSLGATFRPTWMDVPPMLYADNPMPIQSGMVFFLHAILADSKSNLAMSLGHSIIINETGAEVVSRLPLEYVVQI